MVVAVDEPARRGGIRPGMPLAQARALRADLLHAGHDPHGDRAAMLALARWMLRFTPVVGILDDAPDDEPCPPTPSTDVNPHPRHAAMRVARFAQGERLLYDRAPKRPRVARDPVADVSFGLALELAGCERLFGGIEPIVRQIDQSLRRLGIRAAVAVAPTIGAAWAMTFDPRRLGTILDEADLPAAIDPLPTVALRLPGDVVASLRHVGIDTIGILRRLPRSKLPSRFGPVLLKRLDQALGRLPEPIVPVEPFRPLVKRVEFEHVVTSLEPILLTVDRLIQPIVAELHRRGRGARRLTLVLLRPGRKSTTFVVSLARPSRDPTVLLRLARCAIENDAEQLGLRRGPVRRRPTGRSSLARPSSASRRSRPPSADDAHDVPADPEYVDDGFVGIEVSVDRSEPIVARQVNLSGQDDVDRLEEERARLVERLSQSLGPDRVLVARPLPAFLPEKSFRLDPALTTDVETPGNPGVRDDGPPRGLAACFPPTLLPTPREARVVVWPSHDRNGKPAWIDFDRLAGRVVHCFGPVRIAGQWWNGHHRTRDYFEIEDEQSRRLWLFRVVETGRWFVHGHFG